MRRSAKTSIVLAVAAGAILLLGLALPASASSVGGTLPAGSSVCADQTRSDNGVTLGGIVTTPSAAVTWTVRAADTAGGAEAQIFKAVTYDVTGTNVAAPHPGGVFYRTCLSNTTRSPVTYVHVYTVPRAGSAGGQQNIGPTTAVLGHEGIACGEMIRSSGRLTASSSAPVTWMVRAYNGDLSILRQIRPLTVTSTSVNQLIGPGAYAFLDVCAINHGSAPASLSMQFA